MSNPLAGKYNFIRLLKFAAPTIVMMAFMSFYTIVDGIFVSRLVGTTALSAVNIVFPFINLVIGTAIMLASGASAVIAFKMGENKPAEARGDFSFIVISGVIIGAVITLAGVPNVDAIIRILGAEDGELYAYCRFYLLPVMLFSVPLILQVLFQYLFVTAGKPNIGLITIVVGGCLNIALDYLFIARCGWGITGAAVATGLGYCVPGLYGLLYFAINKKGTLYFTKPRVDMRVFLKSCGNGASEMVTNLSQAVTTLTFNLLMLKYAGEDGVAAITIILYTEFLLVAVYMGFSSGAAPVVSYNYGEGNRPQLKRLLNISLAFIAVCSAATFLAAFFGGPAIASAFAGSSKNVYDITVGGFRIVAFSYLVIGYSIFGSAFFTALSNGTVSAAISFMHTFLFLLGALWLLPAFLGINGVWLSMPVAEGLGLLVTIGFLRKYGKVYGYGGK